MARLRHADRERSVWHQFLAVIKSRLSKSCNWPPDPQAAPARLLHPRRRCRDVFCALAATLDFSAGLPLLLSASNRRRGARRGYRRGIARSSAPHHQAGRWRHLLNVHVEGSWDLRLTPTGKEGPLACVFISGAADSDKRCSKHPDAYVKGVMGSLPSPVPPKGT